MMGSSSFRLCFRSQVGAGSTALNLYGALSISFLTSSCATGVNMLSLFTTERGSEMVSSDATNVSDCNLSWIEAGHYLPRHSWDALRLCSWFSGLVHTFWSYLSSNQSSFFTIVYSEEHIVLYIAGDVFLALCLAIFVPVFIIFALLHAIQVNTMECLVSMWWSVYIKEWENQ